MIVAAHQPHFLPWLGYFDRMRRADLFVLLDHVQFERQNFQNRTRILTHQGTRWLTVPVVQRSRAERIVEKRIDDRDGRWAQRLAGTLQFSYGRAPWFREYAPEIVRILESPGTHLVDLNIRLTEILRDVLEIRTPMIRSSGLELAGQRSELVLNLCRAVGATTYLSGRGASRAYLDTEAFRRAGITLEWQEFRHPVYPQVPSRGDFAPNLSAVDLLFQCGPRSAAILRGEDAPRETEGLETERWHGVERRELHSRVV